MTKSIVIADFPQHAAVRADGGDNGDAADDGKSGETVKNVGRNDQLPELSGRRGNIKRVVLAADHDWAPQACEIYRTNWSAD